MTFADGRVAYYAGDTTVFGDLALIHQLYKPTLAFLPIGDHYTMGPREAALACSLIKATTIFPMHWGTFPALTGTPAKLAELLADAGESGVEVINLPPGENGPVVTHVLRILRPANRSIRFQSRDRRRVSGLHTLQGNSPFRNRPTSGGESALLASLIVPRRNQDTAGIEVNQCVLSDQVRTLLQLLDPHSQL